MFYGRRKGILKSLNLHSIRRELITTCLQLWSCKDFIGISKIYFLLSPLCHGEIKLPHMLVVCKTIWNVFFPFIKKLYCIIFSKDKTFLTTEKEQILFKINLNIAITTRVTFLFLGENIKIYSLDKNKFKHNDNIHTFSSIGKEFRRFEPVLLALNWVLVYWNVIANANSFIEVPTE